MNDSEHTQINSNIESNEFHSQKEESGHDSRENKESVIEEILNEIDVFEQTEKQIDHIESTIDFEDKKIKDNIKSEIYLDLELAVIDNEAEKAKAEALNRIKLGEEKEVIDLEIEQLEEIKETIGINQYKARREYLEFKTLRNKVCFITGELLGVNNIDLSKIELDESSLAVIGVINKIEGKAIELGFESTEIALEGYNNDEFLKYLEELDVESLLEELISKKPDQVIKMLLSEDLKDQFLKEKIFESILGKDSFSIDELAQISNGDLIEDEAIFSSLSEKIEDEKVICLLNLSAIDIINEWESDAPKFYKYNQRAWFNKKFSSYFEDLYNNGQYEKIREVADRLNTIKSPDSDDIYLDPTECLPSSLVNNPLSNDDILKIITKNVSAEEYVNIASGYDIFPIDLIPIGVEGEILKSLCYRRLRKTPDIKTIKSVSLRTGEDEIEVARVACGYAFSSPFFNIHKYKELLEIFDFYKIGDEFNDDIVLKRRDIATGVLSFSENDDPSDIQVMKDFISENNIDSEIVQEVVTSKINSALRRSNIKVIDNILSNFQINEDDVDKFSLIGFYADLLVGHPDKIEHFKGLFKTLDNYKEASVSHGFGMLLKSVQFEKAANFSKEHNLSNETILSTVHSALTTCGYSKLDYIRYVNKNFSMEDMLEKSIYSDRAEQYERLSRSIEMFDKKELIPEGVREVFEKFKNKYGHKGENLTNIAMYAYGVDNVEAFKRNMKDIENVLDKYNHEGIPEDARVSMGIEYEVTSSIDEEYSKNSFFGYKADIQTVSEIANIGRGNDAIHEIATKPNYNPYMLMAEVKLLQDAGFMDLNFERYQSAPRGYHLSIVGNSGLKPDGNMNFVHNAMTMAQFVGVTSGKNIRSTKGIHSKSFEFVDSYIQKGTRCEFKGMATDSIEQFEKSIMTVHHAGIAIQLSNKYFGQDFELKDGLFKNNKNSFEADMIALGMLKKPFESEKEKLIVFEWMRLREETKNAIDIHNEQFINSEFDGFILDKNGAYVDTGDHIDINRNRKLISRDHLELLKKRGVYAINNSDMTLSQSERFVNSLSNINNIFLKPPDSMNSSVNAKAVISTMKREGYGEIMEGDGRESVFDNGGELRDGYYCVQGASEEMIIHKSQILLNHFNKSMSEILKQKEVFIQKEELVTA